MIKGLDRITEVLRKYSAISFANKKLNNLKKSIKGNYAEYMTDVYGDSEGITIEECEENAVRSFLNEYKKCCEIYEGWLKNGKVFILDKEDKTVLCLYKKDDIAHSSIVHYNPLNVDLIEISTPNKYFFEKFQNGKYDLSVDEKMVLDECDGLVAMEKMKNQKE